MVSKRQHWGMLNHLIGRTSLTLPSTRFVRSRIMRASDGVISGRSVTPVPSLSSKLYICCVISSPALRSYSPTVSSTGASYSWKPKSSAALRMLPKSQLRSLICSGKKSRVPDGGARCSLPPTLTAAAAAAVSAFLKAGPAGSPTRALTPSKNSFVAFFCALSCAACSGVGLPFGLKALASSSFHLATSLSRNSTLSILQCCLLEQPAPSESCS